MVERDHDCGGNEYSPVAIEGEEHQRAEYLEVRLDAAAHQMNRHSGREHWAGGNAVMGDAAAGPKQG
jgi:hypothetical protein